MRVAWAGFAPGNITHEVEADEQGIVVFRIVLLLIDEGLDAGHHIPLEQYRLLKQRVQRKIGARRVAQEGAIGGIGTILGFDQGHQILMDEVPELIAATPLRG